MQLRRILFFIGTGVFLSLPNCLFAYSDMAARTIFIPIYQNFSFARGEIVIDRKMADIVVLPYGIEAAQPKGEIAPLKKGFLADMVSLPQEAHIEWSSFADYNVGMIYSVKCINNKYGIFELINVKVSDDEIIGIEIEYKYQPDGSREFEE